MNRKMLGAAALAFAFTTVGAMAQTPPPVPNASGSQVTNPADYRNTKPDAPGMMMNQGQGPAVTGSTTNRPPPVPNASGSQVTNPADIRNTKPQ